MNSEVLEGMDKEVTLLAASVRDAQEKWQSAKAMTVDATRTLAVFPYDKLLQLRLRHAKMREDATEKHLASTKLQLTRTSQSRQAMAEVMNGAGERPALR